MEKKEDVASALARVEEAAAQHGWTEAFRWGALRARGCRSYTRGPLVAMIAIDPAGSVAWSIHAHAWVRFIAKGEGHLEQAATFIGWLGG